MAEGEGAAGASEGTGASGTKVDAGVASGAAGGDVSKGAQGAADQGAASGQQSGKVSDQKGLQGTSGTQGVAPPPAKGAEGEDGTKAAAKGTLAGEVAGDGTKTEKAEVKPDFPADWRERLAGDDKGFLKQLQRFASPLDLGRSYRNLNLKISAGELKEPVKAPENASDEQMAEWRKSQGLPERPEGYIAEMNLGDGVVPGEADKPLLDSFSQLAIAKNWTQDTFNDAVSWYYGLQDQLRDQRIEQDDAFKDEATLELSQEWGQEFKANQRALANLWALFPAAREGEPSPADLLLTARLPNGNIAGNDPGVLRGLVSVARELFPHATIMPTNTGDIGKAIGDEITAIEGKMYNDRGQPNPEYWKGESGEKMQARYRDLIEARDKQATRGRAA